MITKSKRVVYWIGAGASYNALPVVTEFSKGITEHQHWLNGLSYGVSSNNPIGRYSKELKALADHGLAFGTVDTYARSLHLLEDWEGLAKLKLHLSMYFVLETIRERRIDGTKPRPHAIKEYQKPDLVDTRYMGLLAVLMESKSVADNVQIVSWNYDLQIQQALSKYLGLERPSQLHGYGGIGCIMPKVFEGPTNTPTSPFLIQLNGTAGNAEMKNGVMPLYDDTLLGKSMLVVNRLFQLYDGYDKGDQVMLKAMRNTFRFAWEGGNEAVLDCAYRAMEQASVLVIIGYSFPSFNRTLDKELYRRFCQRQPESKYVVIQNPSLTADTFRRIMGDVGGAIGSVQEEKNLSQFYIPPELF